MIFKVIIIYYKSVNKTHGKTPFVLFEGVEGVFSVVKGKLRTLDTTVHFLLPYYAIRLIISGFY